MKRKHPLIAIFLGVMGFSLRPIFIKMAYSDGIPPVLLMSYRMMLSIPFFIVAYLVFRNNVSPPSWRRFGGILACALLYYIASLSDILGLDSVSVNIERIILFTMPIFVILISRFFLKKKFDIKIYFLAILSWVGILITFIGRGASVGLGGEAKGILFILISAISFAAYFIMSSHEMKKSDVITFNAQVMGLACFFSLIPFFFSEYDISFNKKLLGELTYPLMLAVFSTVIPSFLMMYGVKHCGPEKTSIINNIGPFITMFCGYVFLSEVVTGFDLLGMSIVFMSILFIDKIKLREGHS